MQRLRAEARVDGGGHNDNPARDCRQVDKGRVVEKEGSGIAAVMETRASSNELRGKAMRSVGNAPYKWPPSR